MASTKAAAANSASEMAKVFAKLERVFLQGSFFLPRAARQIARPRVVEAAAARRRAGISRMPWGSTDAIATAQPSLLAA
jgi:hypothetical protein